MSGLHEWNDEVRSIVEVCGKQRKDLISVLHGIQDRCHYLPEAALNLLSEMTGITISDIYSVATFYNGFRFEPAGNYTIKVCIGTACHIKGAEKLYQSFKDHLHIPGDQDTDKDRVFTVEKVACLGCCMIAPAVQIGDLIYGPVGKSDIPAILSDFLKSRQVGLPANGNREFETSDGLLSLCLCSSCSAVGANRVYSEILRQRDLQGLQISVKTVGCTGISFQCPILFVDLPDGTSYRYGLVRAEDVPDILKKHFSAQKPGSRLNNAFLSILEKLHEFCDGETPTRYLANRRDVVPEGWDTSQCHISTSGCGKLPPTGFDEYIQNGGFEAYRSCLLRPREEALETLRKSGLRGRGGAGFSTWMKWVSLKHSEGEPYLVCNADEGDPGAFMDRMLLESFPFRVIEGMMIASLICGIRKGFVFLRAEYPLAVERVKAAIDICKKKGVLPGKGIETESKVMSGLEIDLVVSAGAFVCGEETALIRSIEGKRAEPQARPPYPTERGLWGNPTLVNNVETFSLLPWIMLHGGERFSSLGISTSTGTKTFALAGKIRNGGLIEIEMGTPLRKVVYEIGGGIEGDRKLKAVQIGGPSGGCIPAELLDTMVDYESLQSTGAMMGSGGLVVLDEEDCMVDMARYFISFTQDESCGKCTFGRIGTRRMLEILNRLVDGESRKGDLDELQYLSKQIKKASLCGLCRSAPNPVISGMKYFMNEFLAHAEGVCPAKKCPRLIRFHITEDCIGCTRCAQKCPVQAIEFVPYQRHSINTELCVKCDTCRGLCPTGAVVKVNQNEHTG